MNSSPHHNPSGLRRLLWCGDKQRAVWLAIILLAASLPAGAEVAANDPGSSAGGGSVFNVFLDTVPGGSGSALSKSFGLYGIITYRDTIFMAGEHYRTRQGFVPAVFEIILNPLVVTIDPNEGYNIAPVRINKIGGANFRSNAAVTLTSSTEPTITAYNVNVVSSGEITCDFNLAGVPVGPRDVVITNPGQDPGILPGGFTVKSYPLGFGLVINSPNPFDPARETTTLMYRLEKDAPVIIVFYSIAADLVGRINISAGENGGRAGENAVIWNGMTDYGALATNSVYLVHVVERGTGKLLARGKVAVLRR